MSGDTFKLSLATVVTEVKRVHNIAQQYVNRCFLFDRAVGLRL